MSTVILNQEISRRNFAVFVSTLQNRGKSLSDALRIAEFSFKRKQKNPVEEAKQLLRENEYLVDGLWQKDDVRYKAEEMEVDITDKQVQQVMDNLRGFDASIGINWDTIEYEIENVIED